MLIKGSVFVVTGGSSGLGEATVRNVVKNGGSAVIFDMNEELGLKLAEELKPHAIFLKTDVSSEGDVKNSVDRAVEVYKKIDGLVNCAGIGFGRKMLGRKGPHPFSEFERTIQVNLIGTFNTMRLVSKVMVENTPNEDGERGVIVNTSSGAAYEGQIGQAAYSSSKGGVGAMTLPVAREFADHGIRVVTIAPGAFETPMFGTLTDEIRQSLIDTIPFPKRMGRPEEFARMVQCICEIAVLNGCVIRLDGAVRMQAR